MGDPCGDGILSGNETCDPADNPNIPDTPLPCGARPRPCPAGQQCINCTCQSGGYVTPECGDGILSPGEECDPGSPYQGNAVPCPTPGQECIDCHCVTPEEVLFVECHTHVDVFYTWYGYQYVCDHCTLTISFRAEDISSGDRYPVTNVALIVDGVTVYDSGDAGPISVPYFEQIYVHQAGCGETTQIEVRARNSAGLEGVSAGFVPCGT